MRLSFNPFQTLIYACLLALLSCQPEDRVRVAAGEVITFDPFSSRFVQDRRVDVWLPEGYATAIQDSFPVIYMQDGQNLFDPTLAYGGVEWQVDETLSRLSAGGRIPPVVVVGIWNTADRFLEYAPEKPFEGFPKEAQEGIYREHRGLPKSDEYLAFIVEELKPHIDSSFRVARNLQKTLIMGSSMGGLVSLYAMVEHPLTFGRAAGLSTHWPVSLTDSLPELVESYGSYLKDHYPRDRNHRLWLDRGTLGLDSRYQPFLEAADSFFTRTGFPPDQWSVRVYPGEDHNESAWARRLPDVFEFLLN